MDITYAFKLKYMLRFSEAGTPWTPAGLRVGEVILTGSTPMIFSASSPADVVAELENRLLLGCHLLFLPADHTFVWSATPRDTHIVAVTH